MITDQMLLAMRVFLSLMLVILLSAGRTWAQYPFERFHQLRFDTTSFIADSVSADYRRFSATYKTHRIIIEQDADYVTTIRIYNAARLIGTFTDDIGPLDICLEGQLNVADVNGDGFRDFKITAYNNGSGLAGSYERKIYLFGSAEGFQKCSYLDFFSFPEVDMNGDKNYEIIGCYLARTNGHSYWTFDLYNYVGGRLINVSARYRYPIMVQYLNRDNFTVTKHFTRAEMRKFSQPRPGGAFPD